MSVPPWIPPPPRGARALRGTIEGAVRRGWSLQQLLDSVRGLYSQQGAVLRAQTEDAIARQFAAFVDSNVKSRSLEHTPGTTALHAGYVSFASLERPLWAFNENPRALVRYRVSGTLAGAPYEQWMTTRYEGIGALPATVGGLRNDLWARSFGPQYGTEPGADMAFRVSDVAITAY